MVFIYNKLQTFRNKHFSAVHFGGRSPTQHQPSVQQSLNVDSYLLESSATLIHHRQHQHQNHIHYSSLTSSQLPDNNQSLLFRPKQSPISTSSPSTPSPTPTQLHPLSHRHHQLTAADLQPIPSAHNHFNNSSSSSHLLNHHPIHQNLTSSTTSPTNHPPHSHHHHSHNPHHSHHHPQSEEPMAPPTTTSDFCWGAAIRHHAVDPRPTFTDTTTHLLSSSAAQNSLSNINRQDPITSSETLLGRIPFYGSDITKQFHVFRAHHTVDAPSTGGANCWNLYIVLLFRLLATRDIVYSQHPCVINIKLHNK